MRTLTRGRFVVPCLLVAFAGCGGGGGKTGTGGMGGTTGAGGMAGTGAGGMAGAIGAAGTGGATGTGGAIGAGGTGGATGAGGAGGSGGSRGGSGGSGGGTGGATGTGGTGGTGGTMSCLGYDIDIPSTVVTGTFKINGTTVTSTTDAGNMTLRTAAGDVVPLGSTSASSYSVRVVPGTYDLYYQLSAAGATAPRNTYAKLRSVTISGTGTNALDIDVPSVVVTGTIKINGASVTSTTDAGNLSLRNAAGENIPLASTSAGSYSVHVIPGTYDIYYQMATPGASAPRNTAAKLQSVVVAATGTTAMDIDVPSVVMSGMLKINGATVTSTADAGSIALRNSSTGDTVTLGSTSAGSYSVHVVPGSYDIYYTQSAPGATAPRNAAAKLQSVAVAATGTTAMDIDVPSVVLSGALKINGTVVTAATDTGNITLRTAGGDIVVLGATSAGTYSVHVVPGTYDVYYVVGSAGTIAPRNALAKLQSAAVAATGTTALDIDVPSVVVSGMLKINGAPVTSATDSGTLSLRTAAGDSLTLGSTSAGSYSVHAIPGTYDVYYTVSSAGASAPRNPLGKVQSGAVVNTSTTALDIDVPSSTVTGSIRINSTAATSTADYGALNLKNGSDLINIGQTYAGTYTTRLIPGTYDLIYTLGAAGALAPRNQAARVRCFTVQ